jgi:hypothetical protein
VAGAKFVASSLVVFNGTTVATSVDRSSQATVTINSSMIPAPGSFNVAVRTPAGSTDNLGCSSGGTSSVRILAVN